MAWADPAAAAAAATGTGMSDDALASQLVRVVRGARLYARS